MKKKHRAFLKWAGGKYSLIENIRQHLPEGERLIEPFVGAGSVFLNTDYEEYVLADINEDLINLYNIVKRETKSFVKDVHDMFADEYNRPEVYYQLRAEFNACTNAHRRAVLFLYLNRHCYNGLCRYNLKGVFNVPFGRYKKPYFPEDELYLFAEKAQKATFICGHYTKTMRDALPGSVIYCDPPYAPLSLTANFTAYHTNGFTLDDQAHLAELAYEVSSRNKVPVLISNHDTELTQQWYHQARWVRVKARRTISRNTGERSKVDELLALYT